MTIKLHLQLSRTCTSSPKEFRAAAHGFALDTFEGQLGQMAAFASHAAGDLIRQPPRDSSMSCSGTVLVPSRNGCIHEIAHNVAASFDLRR